jgi:hypothetical protein
VSYFRPQKAGKPARGASPGSRIQLRKCLKKGVGSPGSRIQLRKCLKKGVGSKNQLIGFQRVSVWQRATLRGGFANQKLGQRARCLWSSASVKLKSEPQPSSTVKAVYPLEHSCPNFSMAPVLAIA